MNPSITAEQMQAIESALRTYWAGGEPSDPINVEWLRSYLDINCITDANLGQLIAQIYQQSLGAGQDLKVETRRLAVEWAASELGALGEQSLAQSVSDPVALGAMLQRTGVLAAAAPEGAYTLTFMASLLNQVEVAQQVFGLEAQVPQTATDVGMRVDALQQLMMAAQKVWSEAGTLTADDCVTLGLINDAQNIGAQQLDRLNAVLDIRRGALSADQHTLGTLKSIHNSVLALEKILVQAPDAVALTVSDFSTLGMTGVTEANVAAVNVQLALAAPSVVMHADLQSLIDQPLSATLNQVNSAIQQQTTSTLTLQDYATLGLTLPEGFDLQRFNSLLASLTSPLDNTSAHRLTAIAELQDLAMASHKLALMSDALPDNDQPLSANDVEALSMLAPLGMARYDAQAQNLFNQVLQSRLQSGQVVGTVSDLEVMAQTISDLHRLAAGGRVKAALTSERLAQIGVQAEGQTSLSSNTLKGLASVIARTESSGVGIDSLDKLNAMVNAYQSVFGLADGSANSSARLTQAQYAALRITGVDSDLKAELMGDLLDRTGATDVDSVSKLQDLALAVGKVVSYAGGAQMDVTQADLERLGLQGLNEQKTAHVLKQLRLHGADGSKFDQIADIQAMADASNWPTVSAVSLSADTGIGADRITCAAQQTITATLSEGLANGVTLQGSIDGGTTWNDITHMVSDTTITWTGVTLLDGSHGIVFRFSDADSNQLQTDSIPYTLDTSLPTLGGVKLSNDTGLNAADRLTSAPAQTIQATLSTALVAGDSLTASLDDGLTWINLVNAGMVNGTQIAWTDVELLSGANNITFKLQDLAGNESTSTISYTLDTSLPTQTISNLAVSGDHGASSTDRITSWDLDRTITATLSAALGAGETLQGSLNGGTTWVDISNKVSGTAITWDAVRLLEGNYAITFKLQNSLGKKSVSENFAYTLDLTPPAASVTGVSFSADTGSSQTDRITNIATQNITVTLSEALEPGGYLYGSVDGMQTWVSLTDKIQGNSVLWEGVTLSSASNSKVTIYIADAAGASKNHTSDYQLDTTGPTPVVSTNSNGSVAVFAGSEVLSYSLSYTDESMNPHTVLASKSGSYWSATGLQEGSSIHATSGVLRLNNEHLLDGSNVTVMATNNDAAGNAGISVTVSPSADTASQAGNPVIDLGSFGQLLAPVQVEGKWYYVLDANKDFSLTTADHKTMDALETTLFASSTGAVITEANRSFVINGVQLKLPTGGKSSYVTTSTAGTAYSSTTDDPVANSNANYNDLAAIWDAFNGTGSSTNVGGVPPAWGNGSYWSASTTAVVDSHVTFNFTTGYTSSSPDANLRYLAFEVL